MGSGQSAIAALKAGRNFAGYEVNEVYLKLAMDRIEGSTF
jgi:site-specific DNA-methyltransferase (adenine-specific)